MRLGMKAVRLREGVWSKLTLLKSRTKFKTYKDLIEWLIDRYTKTNS